MSTSGKKTNFMDNRVSDAGEEKQKFRGQEVSEQGQRRSSLTQSVVVSTGEMPAPAGSLQQHFRSCRRQGSARGWIHLGSAQQITRPSLTPGNCCSSHQAGSKPGTGWDATPGARHREPRALPKAFTTGGTLNFTITRYMLSTCQLQVALLNTF